MAFMIEQKVNINHTEAHRKLHWSDLPSSFLIYPLSYLRWRCTLWRCRSIHHWTFGRLPETTLIRPDFFITYILYISYPILGDSVHCAGSRVYISWHTKDHRNIHWLDPPSSYIIYPLSYLRWRCTLWRCWSIYPRTYWSSLETTSSRSAIFISLQRTSR